MNLPDPSAVPLNRRRFLAAGLALGLGAVLAGCGGDGADAEGTTGAATGEADPAGFPLTIRHRHGTTTIPAPPRRVVTAGFNDADFALALGVVPVGVADFIGPFPETTRSWAREPLAGARPEVVTSGTGELLLERIAALEPDVIVYYSYLEDAEDYRRLAAIAPTVVEPRAGTLWQRHTLDVGRALGRERQAREQVRRVQARFAREREAHPEFAGTTAAVFFPTSAGPDYYLLEPEDPRTGLFTTLGFRMPEVTGPISRERAALLDQDLLVVVGTTREKLQDDPLVTRLNAVREGRVAYLGGFEGEFAGALGFDSPLSLPVALDLAVPALAEALRGA